MTVVPTYHDAELRWQNAFAWMREANVKSWQRPQAEHALDRYFDTIEKLMAVLPPLQVVMRR
jgi:hypothetical protein